MRLISSTIACLAVVLLYASNTYAQYHPDTVIVLPRQEPVPVHAKLLGSIKNGDNALSTTCDYEEVIRNAKEQAKIMGGNIVKITELVSPVFISKCYRVKADVYHIDTLPHYNIAVHTDTEATQNSKYALLYVYRLKDTLALEPSYDLHLNKDSVLCKIKKKMHRAIKIYHTGTITLWAKTSERQEVKLDVKPGGVYYLRCGLQHGELRLMPFMEIRDPTSGAYEYSKLNKEKTEHAGLEYLQQIH